MKDKKYKFCLNSCDFSESLRKTWIPHGKKFDEPHVVQVPANNADDHVSMYPRDALGAIAKVVI